MNKRLAALLAASGLLLGVPGVASADNVQNDVVVGGNDTITAGGSTTINYRIQQTGVGNDGQAGCNAADGSSAVVALNIPDGVAATGLEAGNKLTFASCGQPGKSVTFSSDTPGSFPITVASVVDGGVGAYSVHADFTLRVNAAPVPEPPADVTPPSISYKLDPASPDGGNGWYRSDVSLDWTVTEEESPSSLAITGCADQEITADQAAQTYSCSASSDGGSAAPQTVTIKRDATAPVVTVTGVSNGSTYNFGAVPTAGCDTTDATSGVAVAAAVSGGGTAVGSNTATCSGAEDNAGNRAAPVPAAFSVQYESTGLLQPINTSGDRSAFKLNSTIPVKVKLVNGSAGVTDAVLNVKVTRLGTVSTEDTVLEAVSTAAATSGSLLRYDSTNQQYIFNLATKPLGVGSYKVEVVSAAGPLAGATISIVK